MTGSPANHEGSSRANIDHIIVFQLLGEKGWAKSPVPANVATSEENHQCHRPNETGLLGSGAQGYNETDCQVVT
jgi:hypothetical protein